MDAHAAVDLLRTLVRAPSPSGRERPAVAAFAAALRDLGYDEVVVDGVGNAIGTLRRGEGPTLVCNGHLDTVPTGDAAAWPVDPLGAEVVDGRLWGRGSVDMKGALAAMAVAGRLAADAGFAGTLVVAGMVQEEVGGLGARWYAERNRADLVVLGEPSDRRLMLGHRGRIEATVELPGRIAHAAKSELGANALARAARFVLALERLALPDAPAPRSLHRDPDPGAHVPRRGGERGARPRRAHRRLPPGPRRRAGGGGRPPGGARPGGRGAGPGGGRAQRGRRGRASLPARQRRLPARCGASVGRVGGRRARGRARRRGRSTSATWWFATDAPYLAAMGAPILGLGPGDPEVAHTTREAMPIDELLAAVDDYRALATAFLRGRVPWEDAMTPTLEPSPR